MQADKTLRGLWHTMQAEKDPYLRRAQLGSSVTLPGLFPPNGVIGSEYQAPYQSLGGQGVQMLASTLMLELFPHDRSFVRYEPDLDASFFEDPETQVLLDTLVGVLEMRTLRLLEISQLRAAVSAGLLYYLVGGLMLLDFREERPRAHRFEHVCLRRDARGNVLTLLVREGLPLELLPEGVDPAVLFPHGMHLQQQDPHLYTAVQRQRDGTYRQWQEVAAPLHHAMAGAPAAQSVPESERTYKDWEASPWVLAGFEWRDGESYPTSFVDRILGDLLGYEGLAKANLESAAIASWQRWLVDPTGLTRREDIIDGPNGSVVPGRDQDVATLSQRERAPDLSWSFQREEMLRRALSEQMLLYLSARRDGERVTATEDNSVQVALNRGLGVGYAQLGPMQKHIGEIYLRRLRQDKQARPVLQALDDLAPGALEMRVTAGVEMLGRQESLQRIGLAANVITQTLGPDAFASIVSKTRYTDMVFNAAGLPRPKFVLTQEEQAEQAQQQQIAQTAPGVAEAIVQGASRQLTPTTNA